MVGIDKKLTKHFRGAPSIAKSKAHVTLWAIFLLQNNENQFWSIHINNEIEFKPEIVKTSFSSPCGIFQGKRNEKCMQIYLTICTFFEIDNETKVVNILCWKK